MTAVMRAAIAEKPDSPLVLQEVPVPEVAPGRLLVRLRASGVCHTDLDLTSSRWPGKPPRFPFIPGHEGCGQVAAVGRGVTGFKEGDSVGVFWLNSACDSCEFCLAGHENVCSQQEGTGYVVDGTYAEYCTVAASFAIPLPSDDYTSLASFMCAGVTSYKAVRELGARAGDVVLVSGVGGTGHMAIQFARTLGCDVAAIDIEDHKLDLAKKLGAKITINAAKTPPVNRMNHATGGGAHGVVVTAVSTAAFEQAVRMLRRRGTCVLVGVPPEAFPLNVPDMILKELTVRGSLYGTRRDVVEALHFAHTGQVRSVTEVYALDAVNQAMDAVRSRHIAGRAVLAMS